MSSRYSLRSIQRERSPSPPDHHPTDVKPDLATSSSSAVENSLKPPHATPARSPSPLRSIKRSRSPSPTIPPDTKSVISPLSSRSNKRERSRGPSPSQSSDLKPIVCPPPSTDVDPVVSPEQPVFTEPEYPVPQYPPWKDPLRIVFEEWDTGDPELRLEDKTNDQLQQVRLDGKSRLLVKKLKLYAYRLARPPPPRPPRTPPPPPPWWLRSREKRKLQELDPTLAVMDGVNAANEDGRVMETDQNATFGLEVTSADTQAGREEEFSWSISGGLTKEGVKEEAETEPTPSCDPVEIVRGVLDLLPNLKHVTLGETLYLSDIDQLLAARQQIGRGIEVDSRCFNAVPFDSPLQTAFSTVYCHTGYTRERDFLDKLLASSSTSLVDLDTCLNFYTPDNTFPNMQELALTFDGRGCESWNCGDIGKIVDYDYSCPALESYTLSGEPHLHEVCDLMVRYAEGICTTLRTLNLDISISPKHFEELVEGILARKHELALTSLRVDPSNNEREDNTVTSESEDEGPDEEGIDELVERCEEAGIEVEIL